MQASLAVFRRVPIFRQLRFSSSADSSVPQKGLTSKAPSAHDVTKENAVYDKVTHTGQVSFYSILLMIFI